MAYSDETESLPFPNGFPNPLLERGKVQILEDALILRAHEQGIMSVSVNGASVPATQGLRANSMLPILTDHLTHTIYRQMNLMFDTDLMETLVVERLGEAENTNVSLTELMDDLERDVQRPLFYNAPSEDGLLGYRTKVSTLATIPTSVTVLLMDAAIESAHTLSQRHQLNLYGESHPDDLDLTPVVESLELQNVNPRVVVPENLNARLQTIITSLTEQQSEPSGQQPAGSPDAETPH